MTKPFIFGLMTTVAVLTLPAAGYSASRAIAARSANDFLNSIGMNAHIDQGAMSVAQYRDAMLYLGARLIRPGDFAHAYTGSELAPYLADYMTILNAVPQSKGLWPMGSGFSGTTADVSAFLVGGHTLAAASKLLGYEGPNEPNNQGWQVTYNDVTGGSTNSWVPVAQLQRDLYAAVQADPIVKGYPVYNASDIGLETPNVGLQWATIPAGSNIAMPDGTVYYDFANLHNYISGDESNNPVDNMAWFKFQRTQTFGGYNTALYNEYGHPWVGDYRGYTEAQLATLPVVTTETGWPSDKPNEDYQGKVTMNIYLSAFKMGWPATFIYEIEEQGDSLGLYHKDLTPKLAATYMHNMTTVLSDTARGTPGTLAYSFSKQPATVHDLLMQKSNGNFELAVWDDRPLREGIDNITVSFGQSFAIVNVYDPTIGTSAIRTYKKARSVSLALTDHPFIVELKP